VDLKSGWLRVLLSLPFTSGQAGRAFWWVSVGVPTLLFAAFSAMGILIVSLAGAQGPFLELWIEMVITGGLLCGSSFWLVTGVPSRGREPGRARFLRHLYNYSFTIAIIGGVYFLYDSTISRTDSIIITWSFGFVFTVLGWFRAEGFLIDCSYRRDVAGAGALRGKFRPNPGFGGVPYFVIRFCLFYSGMVLLLIVSDIGVSVWQNHRFDRSDAVGSALAQVQVWSFGLCLLQALIIGPHLRFLRSLPLTSKRLAATILCATLLPTLMVGGLWTSLFLIKPGIFSAFSVLKYYLLDVAPICVLTTGVAWYNEKHFRRISGIALAFVVSMVPLIYQLATASRGGLPNSIVIAVPVVSIFIALLIISRLLERNEMTYRINFEMRWR
jgi:hypothetical protein